MPILTDREPSACATVTCAAHRPPDGPRSRVVVTGCWATSDRAAAAALPGVDAVLTNDDDVAAELDRLLLLWRNDLAAPADSNSATVDEGSLRQPLEISCEPPAEPSADDGWMKKAGTPAGQLTQTNKSKTARSVNENPHAPCAALGFASLPVLGERKSGRQRAFPKVQCRVVRARLVRVEPEATYADVPR